MTTLGRFGILLAAAIVLAIALGTVDLALHLEAQPGWRGHLRDLLHTLSGVLVGVLSAYLWLEM